MAKKGRKAVLQKSAKAIYAKKASRHDRGRSRPGRPDGGVSAIANSLKRKGSEAKTSHKMKLGGAAGAGQASAAAQPSAGIISSNANKIPFSSDDMILIVGDGKLSCNLQAMHVIECSIACTVQFEHATWKQIM